MKNVLVTGGAGFVGSHMVERCLERGARVRVYDNFSTGKKEFLAIATKSSHCEIVEGDLLNRALLEESMQGIDFVFHFAANADVRFGTNRPERDLEQNTIATFHVLEAMRKHNVKKIAFSSTGSVYGEAAVIPTPEEAPFPIQTSLYGASKVAGEGLIAAYCEGFGFQSWIFRFVSLLGERYTHGHVIDFFKKLNQDPSRLKVLGNGQQRKSYLYISDCIEAMMTAIERASGKVNIFNLGTEEYCQVNDSIRWITQALKVNPKLEYTGGDRGWIGDNPFIFLETKKIRSLGWVPRLTIEQAVLKTVEYLLQHPQLIQEGNL